MLDIMEIMKRIPHRYPFLLVDKIIEMEEGKRIVGIKNVTMNEDFFNGHFPGHPVMPGVLMIEGLAQTLGVLILKENENQIAYFISMDEVKFRKPVKPGDTLIYEVIVEKIRRNIIKAKGVVRVGENIVAEGLLKFSIV